MKCWIVFKQVANKACSGGQADHVGQLIILTSDLTRKSCSEQQGACLDGKPNDEAVIAKLSGIDWFVEAMADQEMLSKRRKKREQFSCRRRVRRYKRPTEGRQQVEG